MEGVLSRLSFPRSVGGTGGWSAKGCELLSRNRTHVSCQCSHMASFAVLMDVSRREVGAGPAGSPALPASVSRDESLWEVSLAPNLPPPQTESTIKTRVQEGWPESARISRPKLLGNSVLRGWVVN